MPTSNYYSPCSTIAPLCQLYTSNVFIPANCAPEGYYSDGVNCYYVTGTSGVVQTVTSCPTTTSTTSSTTTAAPGLCKFIRFVNISDNPLSAPAEGQYQKCTGQPGTFTVSVPFGKVSDPFCVKALPPPIVTSGDMNIEILQAGCPTAPATSTLTFTKYQSGAFTFTLSTPILKNVVISYASVNGYDDSSCTNNVDGDVLSLNELTILALATTGTANGDTALPGVCTRYKKINNIIVNGVTVVNGDTITIGGTVVTIVINTACTFYQP